MLTFVAAARSGPLRIEVIANRSGKRNKVVFAGCQQEGWYAYLDTPLDRAESAAVVATGPRSSQGVTGAGATRSSPSAPASSGLSVDDAHVEGQASVVQFNHPGGEHVTRDDTMPWNTAPPARTSSPRPLTRCRMANAQRLASTGDSNKARTPSPVP